MRAILLGSGQPAIVALAALVSSGVEVVGVGTHAGESEDGVGESLGLSAGAGGVDVAEFDARSRDALAEYVRRRHPDVGFTVGFRYLLDRETLRIPPLGWLNVHSSALPAYRGRAPINWAILEGETELGATMHFLDEDVDAGDVVFQERFLLAEDEDVADALARYEPIYASLIERAVAGLREGSLPRSPMSAGDGRLWPRRTPEDGRIDWQTPVAKILCLVRAVAPPYPGAFTLVGDERLYIYKARRGPSQVTDLEPGLILTDREIACADWTLVPLRMAIQRAGSNPTPLATLASYAGAVCE